ncbi:MAG: toll/interleukin-1 receptor domain-containing protein [Clostridia bacterium]|jgi:hypothetical protein|nr:toll/interleukin-1 receptor domain-containing protein [Clostridia bacterium]
MKKLNDASDVVCLLTRNSVDRPWILYEAGVAKGKLNATVLGISIGIPLSKANNGPFAQFQNCADDEDSLSKLVMQLVKRIPGSEPDLEVIRAQVIVFLTKAKEIIANAPKTTSIEIEKKNTGLQESDVAKLFEEIKLMYSDLPDRIGKRMQPEYRKLSLIRMNPRIIEELLFGARNKNIGFLIVLSMLKNDFPWLFEMGNDLIKLARRRPTAELRKATIEFRHVLEFTFEHPIMREIYNNSYEYRDIREFYHLLMKFTDISLTDNSFGEYLVVESKIK